MLSGLLLVVQAAILGGKFFLGETISEQTLIGGGIIVMGVALITLAPSKKNDAFGPD